jgi:hypothetical protein
MKIKMALLFISLIVLVSCKKSGLSADLIQGSWIESTKRTDTLVFHNSSSMFFLNRGKEIQGEYLLPKQGSGPYTFELKTDSISINWALGGSVNYRNLYFKMDSQNKQFQIENFFVDSLSNHDVLIFTRIK